MCNYPIHSLDRAVDFLLEALSLIHIGFTDFSGKGLDYKPMVLCIQTGSSINES